LSACQVQLTETVGNETNNNEGYENESQVDDNLMPKDDNCPLQITTVMKGVGIFTPQQDFDEMKSACIDVVTTEWGMEQNVNDVKLFLDRADRSGLKVVLDGGFSHTAWGFTNDDFDSLPKGKSPVWQKNRVQKWIGAFKDHPAVCAWDICNEYGENLPSGSHAIDSQWPETVITVEQLIQAKQDVLQVDDSKPILVRMYSWDLNEPPFGIDRLYEPGLANIVMINLYSNYAEDNVILWPEVIQDSGAEFVNAVKKIDSNVKVWIALAAFESHDMFQRPTVKSLATDIEETLKIPELDGIAFFEWGPANQWDPRRDWYLPETGADLWSIIKKHIEESY
jgi:hypothetical protein